MNEDQWEVFREPRFRLFTVNTRDHPAKVQVNGQNRHSIIGVGQKQQSNTHFWLRTVSSLLLAEAGVKMRLWNKMNTWTNQCCCCYRVFISICARRCTDCARCCGNLAVSKTYQYFENQALTISIITRSLNGVKNPT